MVEHLDKAAFQAKVFDYEKSKETALDHYVWLRESYTQYRDEQIRRR